MLGKLFEVSSGEVEVAGRRGVVQQLLHGQGQAGGVVQPAGPRRGEGRDHDSATHVQHTETAFSNNRTLFNF